MPEKYLMVGLSEDLREVVINHPDLEVDANGCGHIVFSPEQARQLAATLNEKADQCVPTGRATIASLGNGRA